MKRNDKSKAFAATRKLSVGSFAPSAPAPLIVAELHLLGRRGLWKLLCFLLLSMAAWGLCASQPLIALPEALVVWLGAPPPVALIDLAFGVYLVSALILLPGRMTAASRRAQGWSQLGYRVSFYLIYLLAAALAERFVVVLAAGVLLYGLEQLYLWGQALWGGEVEEGTER